MIAEYSKNRFGLTKREIELVSAVGQGLSNKDIAKQCRMAEEIVSTALTHILDKTGLRSRSELITFAKTEFLGGPTRE